MAKRSLLSRCPSYILTMHIVFYPDQFYCLDQRRLQIIHHIRGTFPCFIRLLTEALNTGVTQKALTYIKPTFRSYVQEIPYFHKADSFISVFTETRHWSLSRTSRIHSTAWSFQIHFNIFLPSMRKSSNMFSSLHVLRLKIPVPFSSMLCVLRTPHHHPYKNARYPTCTSLHCTITSASSSKNEPVDAFCLWLLEDCNHLELRNVDGWITMNYVLEKLCKGTPWPDFNH